MNTPKQIKVDGLQITDIRKASGSCELQAEWSGDHAKIKAALNRYGLKIDESYQIYGVYNEQGDEVDSKTIRGIMHIRRIST